MPIPMREERKEPCEYKNELFVTAKEENQELNNLHG
jgi:hypothetical protein